MRDPFAAFPATAWHMEPTPSVDVKETDNEILVSAEMLVNRRGFVWFGFGVALFASCVWTGSYVGGSLWAQSAAATTSMSYNFV